MTNGHLDGRSWDGDDDWLVLLSGCLGEVIGVCCVGALCDLNLRDVVLLVMPDGSRGWAAVWCDASQCDLSCALDPDVIPVW